jgi:CubicO group peptidase (beta-lactamase class C family)
MTPQTRFLTLLALATTIAVAALAACGGDDERQVSSEEQPETLDELLAFVPTTDEGGVTGYGLGLQRYELPGGGELLGHLGTTAGYRAFVGQLPEQRIDIALVVTNPDDPSPVLFPALQLMADEAS